MPKAKTKCRACGEFVFVRTRPADRAKVLVTLAQCDVIAEQWAIAGGSHAQYIELRDQNRELVRQLERQLGREPNAQEIALAVARHEAKTSADEGQWGLFRNALLDEAEALYRGRDLRGALEAILAVNYLDLAGPENLREPVPSSGFNRGFRREAAFLAPGVLARTQSWMMEAGRDLDSIEADFLRVAERYRASLKIRVSAAKAWQELKHELQSW